MVFVACGLNHHTAPLTVREKAALSVELQEELLYTLIKNTSAKEAMLLSTCNRTELYCETANPSLLLKSLAHHFHLTEEQLLPYWYLHQGNEGVRHALRVAGGLDSMMLGEPQILGQMKEAYRQACRWGAVSSKSSLSHVFEYVFSASKRIRNQSGIGSGPISVAYAAVQCIVNHFPDMARLRVFLIGSGETASLVARYLHKYGVKHFLVASRTLENAKILAEALQGTALTIGDIPHTLSQADVILSATTCPLPFINKALVQHSLSLRNHSPMFFLDLAVPRDIEADVAELDAVTLYNLDDLQTITTDGMDARRSAASHAEQLVDSELTHYVNHDRARQADHSICSYRDHMQTLAGRELQRAITRLHQGSNPEALLQELAARLVNKLIHHPSEGLRNAALDGRDELFDLIHYLYETPRAALAYEEIA